MSVGHAPALAPDTRQKMLKPYLRQLVGVLEKDTSSEGVKLTISSNTLTVRPWQKAALLDSHQQTCPQEWQILTAEGTAVQARVLNDLVRAERAAESGASMSQEFVLDMGLLLAVDSDIKELAQRMHGGGNSKSVVVQRLIQLRSDLRNTLKMLDTVVDSPSVQDARLIADSLRGNAAKAERATPAAAPSNKTAAARPRKKPKKVTVKGGSSPGVPWQYVAGGVGAIVVSMAILAWMIMPGTVALEEGLGRIQGLEQSIDNKPHFVGVITDTKWNSMDEGARTRFVFAVVTNLKKHDYKSADIQLPDGQIVASWANDHVNLN